MAIKALLLGASGLVGGHVLTELIDDPRFDSVRTLVRRKLGTASGKVQEIIADASTLNACRGELVADMVFCCLGTTQAKAGGPQQLRSIDHDYVLALARIAKENGARSFLLISSLGADPNSASFYLRTKGETERDLLTIGYDSVHILRPSLILGQRTESRGLESMAQAALPLFDWALVGPLRRFRPVDAQKIARAMISYGADPAPGVHFHESDALQAY